jgi:ATP-dependent Clp protease ATP-binding subunit ClpA
LTSQSGNVQPRVPLSVVPAEHAQHSHSPSPPSVRASLPTARRIAELAAEVAEAPTAGDALRKVRELRQELDTFEREQVARALSEGANFSKIARDLGVSRQAVHRRFRALAREEPLLTSPGVARVLRLAREEATSLSADVPSGPHIIVATLRAGDLPAAAVLRSAGATLERARIQVEAATPRLPLFKRGASAGAGDLRDLLAAPARAARARGDRQIEVEHLLIETLADEASGAARTLRALGVDVEVVREELAKLLEPRDVHCS